MTSARCFPGLAALLMSLGLALSSQALAAPQYTFVNLGNLGTMLGVGYSEAVAINNAGQVIGNSWLVDSDGSYIGYRAFRWENGTMTELGCLPGCGTEGSVARGINSAGLVVGSSYLTSVTGVGARPVIFDGAIVTNLGTLPYGWLEQAVGRAINDHGQVVGDSYYPGGGLGDLHAFIWTEGVMTDLGSPSTNQSGVGISHAVAVNNAGQVLGWYHDYQEGSIAGFKGVLWDNGSPTLLDMFQVNAINDAGQVVGTHLGDLGWRATFYDGQSEIDLGVLGLDPGKVGNSWAKALNETGQVVGNSEAYDSSGAFRGMRAFLWQNGTMINLGGLGMDARGDAWSWAVDINEDGQVVGYARVFDEDGEYLGDRAFLWTEGEHFNLNTLTVRPPYTVLTRAVAINDEGWIIGDADGPEGAFAFLLVPVPEPQTYLMLMAGWLVVALAVRRRR